METEPELATTVAQVEAPASAQATTYLAGVSGVVDPDLLRVRAAELAGVLGGARLTIAYPGAETARVPVGDQIAVSGYVDLMTYPLPTAEGASSPWAQTSAAQAALLGLAGELQAQTVVLVHPDLAALAPESFQQLAAPVHAHQADLVMASYTQGPFDSLLNHSILAPLTRALYGKRVRFPLAPDLALSPRLAARLAMSAHGVGTSSTPQVLWPATVAAGIDASVFEAQLSIQHPSPAGDMDLPAVIALLIGSAFAEMEAHAPLWQRVRSTPSAPMRNGSSPSSHPAQSEGIDTAPMVSSFLLGSRSLQDVWGTVLPPVTLLDLKRLTLLAPKQFRVPDELWVRILYDFALGFRLRTINRTHLLGALTPLYLGWVASYINEAAADPAFHAEARLERLARAFEDGKPYLVRRWRWPDRFNP